MSNSKSFDKRSISPALGDKRLAISVKEARKLLGKDFKDLSDSQIQNIIVKLDLIAQGFITQSIST